MPLSSGTRLGPYEITAPLGAGGMGEVYRATDTKLGRDVAIKVIPEGFAQDADRMARFTREAQVLASLNHPNIAAIYGVEERALVMELVEGETLKGPLPLDQALPIIHQLIDALEYAHEKGIVHRDLKPANIKVTPEGRVKVLDFGLAKAMTGDTAAGDPTSSPTLTMRATMAGMIIGTAAYMSPEQARGKQVDKRSDIFAFGVVLYELLTGKQAFGGETISDSLAVILTKEPDRQLLPAATPPNLRRLLDRCLEKDPKRRLRDIGEARILLEQSSEVFQPPSPVLQHRARLQALPWAIAGVALLAAGAATWAWLREPKPVPRPVFRFTAPFQPARFPSVAMSHDGSKLAYVSGPSAQIHLRLADQLEAKPIPGTEDSGWLSFSPDGQWLAFGQGAIQPQRKVKKVQVVGGAVITLCDGNPSGLDWGRDGNIIFGTFSGLSRVSVAGGKPEVLTTPDPKKREAHRFPHILPGGEAVLFTIGILAADDNKIAVLSLKTREQRVLVEGGSSPRYVPAAAGGTGYLIYWRAGSLFAVPFDPRRLEVTGSAVPVLEGVSGRFGSADFSFSDAGTLVYLPGSAADALNSTLVWVNRQGKEQPGTAAAPAPPRPYRTPRLSPDGQRVAVSVGDRTQNSISVYDAARGTLTRLSFQGNADYPVWTPDGKRLTFGVTDSGKNFVSWVPADGSGPPEPLATLDRMPVLSSWSPDGKILAFHHLEPPTDIWLLPFEAAPGGRPVSPAPRRYQETPFDKFAAQFSPDGRWLAYGATSEQGRVVRGSLSSSQVYVQPAPTAPPGGQPGGKWQVSVDGGTGPRWSRDGRELFFRNGDKVMSAAIEPGPTFRAGTPRMLFEGRYAITYPSGGGYDVSPDGQRFLMIKSVQPEAASTQMHFVLEWFEEVRRRMQAGAAAQ
jgi:Tol biopolymer transport system component/predicted Ser/Thr protein kinase